MSLGLKALVLPLCIGFGLVPPGPAWAGRDDERDVAAIRKVVELFRTSLIDKDRATFLGLFVSEDPREVTWRFVIDDAQRARALATKPGTRKAGYSPGFNHVSFIDRIVSRDESSKERFSDVDIDTDGEVASARFDYVFLVAGRPMNRGREMWQLLRTEDGWKIVSVVWSIRDPRAP
ncbi:MAG: hypothetical protein QM581_08875 [Pseudomonas sp.]